MQFPTMAVPLMPALFTGFGVRHSLNNHSEAEKTYICKITGLNKLPWLFQVENTIGEGLARAELDMSSTHPPPRHFSSPDSSPQMGRRLELHTMSPDFLHFPGMMLQLSAVVTGLLLPPLRAASHPHNHAPDPLLAFPILPK